MTSQPKGVEARGRARVLGPAQIRFLAIFALATPVGFVALWPLLPAYARLLGHVTAIVVTLVGPAATLIAAHGEFARVTFTLAMAGAGAQPLAVDFPTLAPAMLTALLLATPGFDWRRLLMRLGIGHFLLLVLRAASLVGHFFLESGGLALTEAIEPAEALVIVLAALDRAGPLVLWVILAGASIAGLAPVPPGRRANR